MLSEWYHLANTYSVQTVYQALDKLRWIGGSTKHFFHFGGEMYKEMLQQKKISVRDYSSTVGLCKVPENNWTLED